MQRKPSIQRNITASRGLSIGVKASIVALAVGMALPGATAAELRPSWECLPADTAVMVRVPGLSEFWNVIQTRTKFGSVVLGPKRLEGLWKILASIKSADGKEPLGEYEESLRKYGLEPGDVMRVFDAEMGGGLVVRKREGLEPLLMVLSWSEPGDEVAAKLLAASRQLVEESADEEVVLRRTDLELAGHDVMMVTEPVFALDFSDIDFPDGEEFDEAAMEAWRERRKQATTRQTGEQYTFVTVKEGRLLVGAVLTSFDAAEPDADDVAGAEAVRGIFATFLEGHAGGGEPALAAVLREPALAATRLPGIPLIEIVGDPRVVLDAVTAESRTDPDEVRGNMAAVGIDDLGGMVMRHTFDDGRWRAAMAMTLPSPRHGILEILDQPCDASEVPPFVTRETAEFTQLSLDLGAAYKTIRQVLLAQVEGDQVANIFDMADNQSMAWLGIDVPTVLSGLGSRHWILQFPPQVAEAIAKARAAEDDDEDDGQDMPLADRLAVVWQVADEGPYATLIGRLAPMVGGQMEEEQGFRGVRLPGCGAFYVGHRHLVVAIGEGVLEKTLAAIRTPPQGENSLRESDVPRRAAELIPMRPGRSYGVSDSTKSGGSLGMLRDLAAAMEPGDFEDDTDRGLFAGIKDLLPTVREMEGMFGIGAALMRTTDDGVVYETAWEMPAP